MTTGAAFATVLLSALAAIGLAAAKDPAPPGTADPAPVVLTQGSAKPASRAEGAGAADADARACLDQPSNLRIIACAEKYRQHGKRARP